MLLTSLALAFSAGGCGGKTGSKHRSDDAVSASGGAAGNGGFWGNENGGDLAAGGWIEPPATSVFEDDLVALVVGEPLPSSADCAEPPGAYQLDAADACLGSPLSCFDDEALFADACGCGCTTARFNDTGATIDVARDGATVNLPADCNGPSGLLALFTKKIEHMVLVEGAVYVWLGPDFRRGSQVWRIDKELGTAALVTEDSVLFEGIGADRTVTSGGVVSTDARVCDGGGGYTYYVEDDAYDLYRAPSGGGNRQRLGHVGFEPNGTVAAGSDVFVTGNDGSLWRAWITQTSSLVERIELLGSYDQDDYAPLIGVDDDAVYWFAGPDLDSRMSDSDAIALYRTCRPLPGSSRPP